MPPEKTLVEGGRRRSSSRDFTVEQANRALVYVRKVVSDIVRTYRRLLGLRLRRAQLLQSPAGFEHAEALREDIGWCVGELKALSSELSLVGCELKDWRLGLVDFPSTLDDRRVLLCWRLDEPAVGHWHEATEGFADRKPLQSESPN